MLDFWSEGINQDLEKHRRFLSLSVWRNSSDFPRTKKKSFFLVLPPHRKQLQLFRRENYILRSGRWPVKRPCLTLTPIHLSDSYCLLVSMAMLSGYADCIESGGVAWLRSSLYSTWPSCSGFIGTWFANTEIKTNECQLFWIFHLCSMKKLWIN